MPGLHSEGGVVAAAGSPVKKSKLSLKFFQKKDTKRALDFSEAPAEDNSTAEPEETTKYGMLLQCYQIWIMLKKYHIIFPNCSHFPP